MRATKFFTLILLVWQSQNRCVFCEGFTDRVQKTFRRLTRYDGIYRCIETAREKAESLRDDLPNWDSYYSVMLVNMYTNPSCYLSSTESRGLFYEKLNKVLQDRYPRSRESLLWRRVGELVNKALRILKLETVQVVYRGCNYVPNISGAQFRFRMITSTSKNPRVAEMYSGCKTLILIENTLGLDVEKYSQVPDEEEVLLPSTHVYEVVKYTKNETEINSEMERLHYDMQPEVFLLLRQIYYRNRIFFCCFGIRKSYRA